MSLGVDKLVTFRSSEHYVEKMSTLERIDRLLVSWQRC